MLSQPGKSAVQPKAGALRGFWSTGLGASLRNQAATWFVGTVIALLSVFSSNLTEGIKDSIHRSDLRAKSYEEMAQDLSAYVFASELWWEYIDHGWTSREAITPLMTKYNESITTVRKKEFVYLSWLSRSWGKADVKMFADVMVTLRALDHTIQTLNDEVIAVAFKGSKETIDRDKGKAASLAMRPILDTLRGQVQALLVHSS